MEFNLPRDAAAGYVNNQREHYEFRFNGVIGPEAKQDEVGQRACMRMAGRPGGGSASRGSTPASCGVCALCKICNSALAPSHAQVFERVARNVVMGSMEGYNGVCWGYMKAVEHGVAAGARLHVLKAACNNLRGRQPRIFLP